jgi:hypothetical protein
VNEDEETDTRYYEYGVKRPLPYKGVIWDRMNTKREAIELSKRLAQEGSGVRAPDGSPIGPWVPVRRLVTKTEWEPLD